MINRYYQQELSLLRDLAVEFAQAHPALAPMLSGATQDPDVERLLEGTAFLTGLLRQKLDDEFPEVVHGLMSLVFPHYLRPLPSTTVVVFTPKQSLMESILVPKGVALDSVPVDGTKCTFQTCYDVEVHPLKVTGARLIAQPGNPTFIVLGLELTGVTLADWNADRLRFFLGGGYSEATNLFQLLLQNVVQVRLSEPGAQNGTVLGPECVTPVGWNRHQNLIPYPTQSFPGYRLLQEYFIRPEKFLFLELTDLKKWKNRPASGRFEISFQMKNLPTMMPQVKADRFVLFATPAVNLFKHDGDPISLDHRQPEYRVIPSGGKPDHYQVYSVEKVTGFAPGTVQRREYAAFELFAPMSSDAPVYYVNRKLSPIRPRAEVYLSVAYPQRGGTPVPETLSINLMCTNYNLPENLKFGDISEPTSTSPELCEFKNILAPSAVVQPPLGKNVLWRFLSHLSLNFMSLGNKENLKVLLNLYIFVEGRDKATILANEKRVEGVTDLTIETKDRLIRGLTLRGQEIRLKLNPDNFASRGDMYLFGCVMDNFFGTYSSLNAFTRLIVEDALTGDIYSWPMRLGDRPLI